MRSDWAYSSALMTKSQPLTRHIVSINDLSNKEIEIIFQVAHGFLKELADPGHAHRIGRGTSIASKQILASLLCLEIGSSHQFPGTSLVK